MLLTHATRKLTIGVLIAGLLVAGHLLLQQSSWAEPDEELAGNRNAISDASSEVPAKEKLLASPQWKQMYSEFQKWLASQPIYTPSDIKRINANLAAQIQAMSASEVQGYLGDWQAKLNVLKGKDFQDAQQWLGQYLSVLADGYRRGTLRDLGLSDFVSMKAGDLERAILDIRAKRFALERRSTAFDQSRQQMIQQAQEKRAAARAAQLQSRSRAARFATIQSPYRPPKFDPPPPPRRQFYVDSYGRLWFLLPY